MEWLEKFPLRSPKEVSIFLQESGLVQGKSFCDLGCGAGDLMMSLQGVASSVCGVDRSARGRIGRDHGRPVELLDYLEATLPIAQVYYMFPYLPDDVEQVWPRLPLGALFIVGDWPGMPSHEFVTGKRTKVGEHHGIPCFEFSGGKGFRLQPIWYEGEEVLPGFQHEPQGWFWLSWGGTL